MKNELLETELIVSQLWDRGTTGVYEADGGEVVAGFESEEAAGHIAAWLRTVEEVAPASITIEPAATESTWAVNAEAISHQISSQRHEFAITITAEATFGHGGHPTTELALDLLLASVEPGMRVLDLGTGSGVLAIAAAKAGAGPVAAIDIDRDAVTVAARNAEANGVTIDCSTSTVRELRLINPAGFDLIVMNVLLPVHRELASDVLAALAPAGVLVTSGYLSEQSSELTALYTGGSNMTTVEAATAKDWAANSFAMAGPG